MSNCDQFEYERDGDSRDEVGLKCPYKGARMTTGPTAGTAISLDRLLDGVTDGNLHSEVDAGLPRGREVW